MAPCNQAPQPNPALAHCASLAGHETRRPPLPPNPPPTRPDTISAHILPPGSSFCNRPLGRGTTVPGCHATLGLPLPRCRCVLLQDAISMAREGVRERGERGEPRIPRLCVALHVLTLTSDGPPQSPPRQYPFLEGPAPANGRALIEPGTSMGRSPVVSVVMHVPPARVDEKSWAAPVCRATMLGGRGCSVERGQAHERATGSRQSRGSRSRHHRRETRLHLVCMHRRKMEWNESTAPLGLDGRGSRRDETRRQWHSPTWQRAAHTLGLSTNCNLLRGGRHCQDSFQRHFRFVECRTVPRQVCPSRRQPRSRCGAQLTCSLLHYLDLSVIRKKVYAVETRRVAASICPSIDRPKVGEIQIRAEPLQPRR